MTLAPPSCPGSRVQVVSCGAIAQCAPQFWETAEQEDERRHAWTLQMEAEATGKIEQRIEKQNHKLLPGDYAMARLGEMANSKARVADCQSAIALQQAIEVEAEEKRRAGERVFNWARMSDARRTVLDSPATNFDDWRSYHLRRQNL